MSEAIHGSPIPLAGLRLGFVGGGNMAIALLGGLVARGLDASKSIVIEPYEPSAVTIQARHGVQVFAEPVAALAHCDAVLLATKPQHLRAAASATAAFAPALAISIAAGVRVADIARWLGGRSVVVRCMPNTPALIGAGMTGLYAGADVTPPQRALADLILSSVGQTIWIDDEAQLDLVTAVSGSGPGYVFYWMAAMQQSAVAQGLSEATARTLVVSTFAGASALAQQSTESLEVLRQQVTSKGGTTAAAIDRMDNAAVAGAIQAAIDAACARAREMGDEFGGV